MFNETLIHKASCRVDTYKKDLDAICSEPLHLNWDKLREDIKARSA